mgnify:CR=1 FL=1
MKLWFTRKGFRESHEAKAASGFADDKAAFDATVEQTLRAAQAINETPSESASEAPARDIFDIFRTLREPTPTVSATPAPETEPPQIDALQIEPIHAEPQIGALPPGPAAPPAGRAVRTGAKPGPKPGPMRAEVERRAANYRAFQIKLNEDREARIRKTMADVRSQLQRLDSQGPRPRP